MMGKVQRKKLLHHSGGSDMSLDAGKLPERMYWLCCSVDTADTWVTETGV